MTSQPSRPTLVIVGGGPRGISVLERVSAGLAGLEATVHLVDDVQPGAGRVWRTDQTHTLCMNTLAGAVTLFTEPGSTTTQPVVEGPTMHEWIRLIREEFDVPHLPGGERETTADIPEAHRETFARQPVDPTVVEDYREEIARTEDYSNPSRGLYGDYLRWVFELTAGHLDPGLELHVHTDRVVAVEERGERDVVRLAGGGEITADAVVLAQGWLTPAANPEEDHLGRAAESGQATWVRPGNPIDQGFEAVPAGETVLVRGLGMGFFDAVTLLTVGRGGRHVEDESSPAGLRYEPSGREPRIVAGSRRGYPFLPKSDYRSLPPNAEMPRLKRVIEELSGAGRGEIDFTTQVWPAILRDALAAFVERLAELDPGALNAPLAEVVADIDSLPLEELRGRLRGHLADPGSEFWPADWFEPLSGFTGTVEEITAQVATWLARDIDEAAKGRDSALKAGLWSISSARKPAAILGEDGRYTAESRRGSFHSFMALGGMVGSGPPLFRSRELLALVEAGIVGFVGAGTRLEATGDGFALGSDTLPEGETVSSTTLVDAWLHQPSIAHPGDPLTEGLVESGRVRPFAHPASDGRALPGSSPEVEGVTRRVVRADGTLDPRLHLLGIPTSDQWADTTISPFPGTDPKFLRETDAAATSALDVLRAAADRGED
ncbi:FAD/NAD(P)-binding protein [Corynebacterium otitidis]